MACNTVINIFITLSMIGLIYCEEPLSSTTPSSSTTGGPCGENEEIKECPKACGTNCSDFYSLDNCFDMCWQEPKCECISGYAYSDTLKKCVPVEECPRSEIICPPNQKYTPCKTKDPCKPGCICKKGYKLDAPTGQCYSGSALCPDPHSYWDSCSNACFHKTCRTIDEPIWCALVLRCIAACICTEPYVYDEDSKICVTEDYCRNPCAK